MAFRIMTMPMDVECWALNVSPFGRAFAPCALALKIFSAFRSQISGFRFPLFSFLAF
jgi:hypothetical protein